MKLITRDPLAKSPWLWLPMHYAGQTAETMAPCPKHLVPFGVTMMNVEESAIAPDGKSKNVHYCTRADNPVKAWRGWAIDIIRSRAASIGCPSYGMYSTPTCGAYWENQTPAKRAEVVDYMAATEDMLGSVALFPTCYDAWADVDGVPTQQEIGNEVSRVRSAMQWACAVREITGLPVYPCVWDRQKPVPGSHVSRWLAMNEIEPIVAEIVSHQPDGIVQWTSPDFVNKCWATDPAVAQAWRDDYSWCLPAWANTPEHWEERSAIECVLTGQAGLRLSRMRQIIEAAIK